jgi:hypothetical protein
VKTPTDKKNLQFSSEGDNWFNIALDAKETESGIWPKDAFVKSRNRAKMRILSVR